MLRCYIDCTTDEQYLTLGLWGKPVFTYPIRAALSSKCFADVVVITSSKYIAYLIQELHLPVRVSVDEKICGVRIDGRSAVITPDTIKRIVLSHKKISDYCLNDYVADEKQNVLVDSLLSFELTLSLVRKNEKHAWLRESVLNRILQKKHVLKNTMENEIILVGHSQFDQWEIQRLCNYAVRNCGISGITSLEYLNDILKNGLLALSGDKILVLLGTNDIVLDKTIDEIFFDYCGVVDYIYKKTDSEIILLECLHISGRLDRDNKRIDELNTKIRNRYGDMFTIISMSEMDDKFGNLNFKYTSDGLHLNAVGYMKLNEIIEKRLGY